MFQKILIAEDTESTNYGLINILNDLNYENIEHEKYCQNALLKIKKAMLDKEPFDLLITDLSFELPYTSEVIKNGVDLIQKAREVQPNLKIIVFSIENRASRIKTLFDKQKVNAFILKGINDKSEIKKAISTIQEEKNYISSNIAQQMHKQKDVEAPNEHDLMIITKIANGYSQQDISTYFKQEKIYPNSLSSIEKRLKILKESYEASNTTHLIFILKEKNFI